MFCFDIETRNFFIFVYQDCYCYRIWLVMMRMTDVKKQTIIMMIRMIKWSRFIWLMFSFLHNVVVVVRFGFKWIWFNKKKILFGFFIHSIRVLLQFYSFFSYFCFDIVHTHTHTVYICSQMIFKCPDFISDLNKFFFLFLKKN